MVWFAGWIWILSHSIALSGESKTGCFQEEIRVAAGKDASASRLGGY
jgi:hypothetical protein